jgi:Tol biopolymer transport system component
LRPLANGDRIGRYRIIDPLGSDGDVFVAEDERLSRRVVLELLSSGPGAAAPRYDRVVALSHPSIVHVYSIEEADGRRFATSELVAGTPLLAVEEREPPTAEKLLQLVRPLVAAVAAAHAEGVVHGRLGPGEVLVAADGRLRILGFGPGRARPAFAWSPGRPGASSTERWAETMERLASTAPEQLDGSPPDPRSDVFSLGVLIHRLATGRVPFEGADEAAVCSAVRDSPARPLHALRPGLPAELGRVVARCLDKQPQRRYRDAGELEADLDQLADELAHRAAARQEADRRTLLRLVAAAVVVALAGVGTYVLTKRPDLALAEARFSQLSAEAGPEFFPSLSPDGGMVVYAGRGSDGWDVFLSGVGGGGSPINLTADSPFADTQPAFSPDGHRIAFRSDRDGGGLFIMGATGGGVRRLTDYGWNPAWSPDGGRVAFATAPISHTPLDRPTRSELWVVSVATGETERLFGGDAVQPSWSPSGSRLAFWGVSQETGHRDVWTQAAEGGAPTRATDDVAVDWSPVWAPDGSRLYYLSDRGGSMNLWSVPIDEASGRVLGEAERVTMPTAYSSHLSFARDANRVAFVSASETYAIAALPFDPRKGEPAGDELRELDRGVDSPRASPTGDRLVCATTGATEREDIVLLLPDGSRRLLTEDVHRDRQPRWAPDGSEIAFYSNRGGSYDAWVVRPDGGGLRRLTHVPGHHVYYPSWSPDGTRMVATYAGSSGFLFDPRRPWEDQKPEQLPAPEPGVDFVPAEFSPDGSRLAGHLQSASGAWGGIAVLDLASGAYRRVSEFGLSPSWLPDGRRLLFQDQDPDPMERQVSFREDHKLFVVEVETGAYREILAVPDVSLGSPSLAPDGATLYFQMVTTEADVWLLEWAE